MLRANLKTYLFLSENFLADKTCLNPFVINKSNSGFIILNRFFERRRVHFKVTPGGSGDEISSILSVISILMFSESGSVSILNPLISSSLSLSGWLVILLKFYKSSVLASYILWMIFFPDFVILFWLFKHNLSRTWFGSLAFYLLLLNILLNYLSSSVFQRFSLLVLVLILSLTFESSQLYPSFSRTESSWTPPSSINSSSY